MSVNHDAEWRKAEAPENAKLCAVYDKWKIAAKGDVTGMDDLCN